MTIFSFAYSDDTLSLTNSYRASSGPVCGDVLEENKGSTYNLSPFDHFKCMTCIRTTTKAKTTVTTQGSTNTYAITNVYKANGTSNAVSFVYRYYYENAWYQTIIEDVVCTGASDYGFQIDCSTYPYGYVVFLIPDDIESCTVNIWTTLAY